MLHLVVYIKKPLGFKRLKYLEVQKTKLHSNKYGLCIYATLYICYWFTLGIFHWRNHFGSTMALVTTRPLRERRTENITGSGGVKAAGGQDWCPQTAGIFKAVWPVVRMLIFYWCTVYQINTEKWTHILFQHHYMPLQHASTLKGSSAGNITDTLQQRGQQIVIYCDSFCWPCC